MSENAPRPAPAPGLVALLVRHGTTDWNEDGRLMGRADVPLNDRGRAQAERVAEALGHERVVALYASPQLRARQTAAPIAEALGLDVTIEPGFDEVWLREDWMGKRVADLEGDPDLEGVLEDPTYVCEALEPLEAVRDRVVETVESLRTRCGEGAFVIVSHGDPLRAIVAHYLGLGLRGIRRFVVDNGSLTSLRFGRRGPRLLYLNVRP